MTVIPAQAYSMIRAEFKASGADLGVIVSKLDGGILHSGVLFRSQTNRVKCVHLTWNRRISRGWKSPAVWGSPSATTPEEQDRFRIAAARAELIFDQKFLPEESITYGIGWGGSTFDVRDEVIHLVPAIGSFGLTCATLSLALCKSAGLDIIVEETWPYRAGDGAHLVEIARARGDKQLAEQLQAEVDAGVVRIHPEEVVAAFQLASRPSPFDAVEPLAVNILARLGVASPVPASSGHKVDPITQKHHDSSPAPSALGSGAV